MELEDATLDPAELSDADVVEAIRAFDHLVSWAGARQARMLAEFARRRPPDPTDAIDRATAGPVSTWAPDEIGLALTLSRGTAGDRIERAVRLSRVLPATLAAWDGGLLDVAKVNAIHDATLCLSDTAAQAVQDRVLPRAPSQTVGQLRAALDRAVIAVDPAGADARHRKAHRQRRVAINPERDGMASLWALLSAPEALNCYGWLTALARGLPACDPRSMDARRADPPLVHLVMPITTLTGAEHGPVELTGYGPLPPALGREIAADAVWKRLLTDPATGAVLDVGRASYRPPAALAEFLRARDRHCRVPITPTGHRHSSRPHDYRPEPDLAAVVAALDRAAATATGGGPRPAARPRGSPFDRPAAVPGHPPPF